MAQHPGLAAADSEEGHKQQVFLVAADQLEWLSSSQVEVFPTNELFDILPTLKAGLGIL